jgi:hypothetical protein
MNKMFSLVKYEISATMLNFDSSLRQKISSSPRKSHTSLKSTPHNKHPELNQYVRSKLQTPQSLPNKHLPRHKNDIFANKLTQSDDRFPRPTVVKYWNCLMYWHEVKRLIPLWSVNRWSKNREIHFVDLATIPSNSKLFAQSESNPKKITST